MDDHPAVTTASHGSRGDLRRGLVVGFGAVTVASVVAMIWIMLLVGSGSIVILDGDLSGGERILRSVLVLALPCAVLASVLAWLAIRSTIGATLSTRLGALVLATAASPVLWGLGMFLWSGMSAGDWVGAVAFVVAGAARGIPLWCLTLAPVWVLLLGRAMVKDDPATRPADPREPSVYGRDEADEDAEIGARR